MVPIFLKRYLLVNTVLKISEATALAFHSMIVLAQNPQNILSVKEIAEELGVSSNHLAKVMQRLVKSRLVVSVKGVGGGFKLTSAPDDITFMDIYTSIEGEYSSCNCLLGKESCTTKGCVMGGFVKSINNQFEEFLMMTRLSSHV